MKSYLTANPPAAGKDGVDGVDGKDGVAGADGKDGADGIDGKDAEPVTYDQIIAAIKSMPEAINEAVTKHLESHPPASGKDGIDGKDGKDAEVTQEALEKAVATHLAAYPIPAGRDGRDGVEGPRGPAGESGKDGTDGIDGKDGVDGINGKDGKDGLSIEDFDLVVSDDERSLTVRLTNGETLVEKTIDLPFVLDRGVYDKGASYRKGDGVTRQGSFWIATEDDPGEPSFTKDCKWRLAVKKGRDGKDGKDGQRGPQGKDGPAGRDLTQMGPDGAKW